ncbi:MAG: ATP synthase F1 subunit epsilon [Candidatus Peregrinibacteria bacterium]|nr:ATP synthase F1 subunit epsilon [Candidatus Peregrinibacteria bacterium]
MPTMHLSIITPDRSVFDGEIESVTLPTADGEITVLPGHVSLIASIQPGSVVARTRGNEAIFAVAKGVIEVTGKGVQVLTDIADEADTLDEQKIEEAKQRAEELMNSKRSDAEGFAEATALLDRELARLRTVRRHRSKPRLSPPTSRTL